MDNILLLICQLWQLLHMAMTVPEASVIKNDAHAVKWSSKYNHQPPNAYSASMY